MAHRGLDNAYGDLKERRAKMDAKYDPELEKTLIEFIEKNSGNKYKGPSFQEWLKDGIVLCELMNKLNPDSCKGIYTGSMAFKQMENISKFLQACPGYGVRPDDVFLTADLYEGTNLTQVQTCIENVRRISELKGKGVAVQSHSVAGSLLMPVGKLEKDPVIPKKEVQKSTAVYSTSEGKDGAYGDLAERMQKLDAKYNPALEAALRKWIESTTGESIGPNFQEGLKSGVILCNLANKLKPKAVASINTSSLAFKQMENINNFLQACRDFGVRSDDLFQTVALFEGSNMTQVLCTLDNLKRVTGN